MTRSGEPGPNTHGEQLEDRFDASGGTVARSIALVALGSALTPLVGALSGPVLARSLGVDGRGMVAAATAPLLFGLAAGTLGLPEAVTYRVATDRGVDPRLIRRVARTGLIAALLLTGLIFAFSPLLADNDTSTLHLMWVATLFLVPALGVVLLRGIAAGLQMFHRMAGEQVVSAIARASILVVLAVTGDLQSLLALLSISVPVVIGGVVYARILHRHPPPVRAPEDQVAQNSRAVHHYGRRVYLGSIGGILLFRLDQLVVAPLSNITELGLYVVAVNVAEILLLTVNPVENVTFATDAATNDNQRAYITSRLATTATLVLGIAISLLSPWLVPLLFGSDFRASVHLIWVLVGAILVLVPGSVAGALLTARDLPQLRSLGFVLGAVVNAVVLVVAVPTAGATGAAWATFAGNAVLAASNIWFARRRAGAPATAWVGVRASDVATVRAALRGTRERRRAR